jgi:hypothetical protein
MRNTWIALAAGVLIAGLSGCCHNKCLKGSCADAPGTCQSCPAPVCKGCGGHGCPLCASHRAADNVGNFTPGPPVGQITYPYYTTRGPRDFLERNPQTIGP